jgi:hypothetical protein
MAFSGVTNGILERSGEGVAQHHHGRAEDQHLSQMLSGGFRGLCMAWNLRLAEAGLGC